VIEEAHALSVEAAFALEDQEEMARLEAFVAALPPARATPPLRAGRARVQAEQAHRRRDGTAAARYEDEAIELLRQVGATPLLARALLERAVRQSDAEARSEARGIYSELGATRWLAHAEDPAEVA
jgi:hypothetical protein